MEETTPASPLTTEPASPSKSEFTTKPKNYSRREVRALVEEYEALRVRADTTEGGLRALLSLADLRRAFRRLTPKQKEALFWHGVARFSQEEVANRLGIDQSNVARRYEHALDRLYEIINRGGR